MKCITEHPQFERIFDKFCAKHYLSPIGDLDYAKDIDIEIFGLNENSSCRDLWIALLEYFFHSKEEIEVYGLMDNGQEVVEVFCEDNQGYHIFDVHAALEDKRYYYCRSGIIDITEFFSTDTDRPWCRDGDDEFNQMIDEYPSNPKNQGINHVK